MGFSVMRQQNKDTLLSSDMFFMCICIYYTLEHLLIFSSPPFSLLA